MAAQVKSVAVFIHPQSEESQILSQALSGIEFNDIYFFDTSSEDVRDAAVEKFKVRKIPSAVMINSDNSVDPPLEGLVQIKPLFAEFFTQPPPQPQPEPPAFVSMNGLPDVPTDDIQGSGPSLPQSMQTPGLPVDTTPQVPQSRNPAHSQQPGMPSAAAMSVASTGRAPMVTDPGSSDRAPSISLPSGALKQLGM